MKKFIICLLIILIAIAIITFAIWQNPDFAKNISIQVEDFIDNITGDNKVIQYSSDYRINELQCKQSDFYYNTLTDNQKLIYSSIAVAIKEMNTKAKIKNYTYTDELTASEDIDISMQSFINDHPEVFYLDNNYTISTYDSVLNTRVEIELNYNVKDKNERDEKINLIKAEIDKILNEMGSKTGFEAELFLHDKVGSTTRYYDFENLEDVPQKCHNIYGTLIDKEAVCDGFAKTMKILLDRVDIDSIMAIGNLEEQLHAWNVVNLDNEWYHLDLTSNKSIESKNVNNLVIHSYFNITTEQIEKSHSIKDKKILPNATATKYNYYINTNNVIYSVENFNTKLLNIINKSDKDIVEFKADGVINVPDKIVSCLRTNKITSILQNNASKFTYYNILDTYVIEKIK